MGDINFEEELAELERAEENDALEREVLFLNIREAMKHKSCRIFIWKILGDCGIFSDMSTKDLRSEFLLGQKSLGISLLEDLDEADPMIYPKLIIENIKRGQENAE